MVLFITQVGTWKIQVKDLELHRKSFTGDVLGVNTRDETTSTTNLVH